jgi:TolB-like protein/Tfp pilus assembly protein PilF
VRHVRPSVPEHVEQAVTRALAPVAADRSGSAAEFARALQTTATTPTGTPTLRTTTADRQAWRRMPVGATTLGLGFLIGLGVLFAWRRSHPGVEDTGNAKVLAVLPFENLGDSADAYFADGVANEVRSKLSQIQDLQVIARGSSNDYKRTTKTQQQIARELGADYLLTATVQWEELAGGASRVRVSPELVDVCPGHAPRSRWGQSFDAALTGVFEVQAEIAEQVAQALNVALEDSAKRELATRPTHSLPAYDAYLRGEAALESDRPGHAREALAAYEQAVALDSTFVEAWAGLAEARLQLYSNDPTRGQAQAVRGTAERLLAVAPSRPEGHLALSKYYYVVAWDDRRGFMEDSIALAVAPRDAVALNAVGYDELYLGRWEEGRRHLEQAVRLDPHSSTGAGGLARVLLYTRHYREAGDAYDRMLRQTPASLQRRGFRAVVALAQGDLASARAIIQAAPKEVDPTALLAALGGGVEGATSNVYDLVWALDQAQQQVVVRLRPSAFDDDRGSWGLVQLSTEIPDFRVHSGPKERPEDIERKRIPLY